MASPPRSITGLKRRKLSFYLTIIKPLDLQSSPADRYAFRGTLGTRDESEARIKALAIRADLETAWAAERERRKPRPAIPATSAIVDFLISKLRHEILSADDLNKMSAHPLAHLPGLPDELANVDATDPGDRFQQIQVGAKAYADALAASLSIGQTQIFELLLGHTLAESGLPELDLDSDPTPFMRWCRGVVVLFNDVAARASGAAIDTPPPPVERGPEPLTGSAAVAVATAAAPATPSSRRMQDLFTEWKAIKTRTPEAIKITERAMAIMAELGIDLPVSQLERHHAATLRAHLVAQGLRGRSVKNLIGPLQALLNVGVDSFSEPKVNPWRGLKIDTSDSVDRIPWRLEDLAKLAQANEKRTDVHATRNRWLFLLLLHTGCRIGEVAQLELTDIAVIDGQWAIEVHDRKTKGHARRTVKTKAGNRVVPVHSVLVALGFLKHVQALKDAGERFLFPSFIQNGKRRPSELAGIDFLALRKAAGVPIEEFWTAHSIRHNVRSALVAANINETQINLTIGHEDGSVQQGYSHAMMPGLVKAVEALDWSEIGISPAGPVSPASAPASTKQSPADRTSPTPQA